MVCLARHVGAACGAAIFWVAVWQSCFVMTGADVLETLSETASGGRTAVVALVGIAGVVLYAMVARLAFLKKVRRPAAVAATLILWIIEAMTSAAYWLAALTLIGASLSDRVTENGIAEPITDRVPPIALIVGAVLVWAALSYLFDRAVMRLRVRSTR